VVVIDDAEVLLVQRTNPPAVGSWSVPAGFLEVDERPEDAAVRELAEETGVSTAPGTLELFGTNLVEHPDGTHVLVIIYRVHRTVTDGDVRAGSDAADARFWDVQALQDSDESIEPSYEPILKAALSDTQRDESTSE